MINGILTICKNGIYVPDVISNVKPTLDKIIANQLVLSSDIQGRYNYNYNATIEDILTKKPKFIHGYSFTKLCIAHNLVNKWYITLLDTTPQWGNIVNFPLKNVFQHNTDWLVGEHGQRYNTYIWTPSLYNPDYISEIKNVLKNTNNI